MSVHGRRRLLSVVDEIVVRRVVRISPSFVRVCFGGDCLADFGVDGPMLDLRIKLIFPGPDGLLPPIHHSADWYADWLALPESRRGSMRTYTPRDVLRDGPEAELVVDIVVHDRAHELGDGQSGPGHDWALAAAPGDRVMVVGPRRGSGWGGIEFRPGDADRILIVADETAAPAAYGILQGLPSDTSGSVLIEVPTTADVLDDFRELAGVDVEWLPRDGAARGALLHEATLGRLSGEDRPRGTVLSAPPPAAGADADEDELVWDTPERTAARTPSGATASATAGATEGSETGSHDGLYAWIAGESKVVTNLRRHLVNELGIARHQVAFMGYWRDGALRRHGA